MLTNAVTKPEIITIILSGICCHIANSLEIVGVSLSQLDTTNIIVIMPQENPKNPIIINAAFIFIF